MKETSPTQSWPRLVVLVNGRPPRRLMMHGIDGHGERDGTRASLFDCCPKPLRSARLNLGVVGYFSEKLGFRLLEKPRSFH